MTNKWMSLEYLLILVMYSKQKAYWVKIPTIEVKPV